MNKHDFVRVVAKETGNTVANVENTLNVILDCILDQLNSGGEVNLTGFGRFSTALVAEKTISSPWTDAPVVVPEYRKPKFKFFDSVKDSFK